MSTTQQDQVYAEFQKLMALREGCRNDVYADSLGKPTVGIGHLVVPADHLKLGDRIADAQVTAFFAKDGRQAMDAAWHQAAEAGITDPAFMPILASVNFQLGVNWTTKVLPHIWEMIVQGNYAAAATALDGTLWSRQTPTRVKDLQNALRKLPPKH